MEKTRQNAGQPAPDGYHPYRTGYSAGQAERPSIGVRWRDYALPATGMPVWILLTAADVGQAASLSNMVVEVFWVLVASTAAPWAGYMTLRLKAHRPPGLYSIPNPIPCAVAALLRLNMPTLPE